MTGSPVQCHTEGAKSSILTPQVRLYIGGLSNGENILDLQTRIQSFVEQQRTSMHRNCALILPIQVMKEKVISKDESTVQLRGFGYADFTGEDVSSVVIDIIKVFNKTKWRGSVLKVETANPHYIEKLRKEWIDEEKLQNMRREQAQAERQRYLTKCLNKSTKSEAFNMAIKFSGTRHKFNDDKNEQGGEKAGNGNESSMGSGDSFFKSLSVGEAVATKKDPNKQLCDASPEKKSANTKRLEALNRKSKTKESLSMKEKGIGISAVAGICNKKVIFDDDAQPILSSKTEEDVYSDDTEAQDWMITADAGTEMKSLKILEFGSDSGDDVAEHESSVFAVRPEFTGVKGKELFELQKSYKGDSRFRLDTRFMEEFLDPFDDTDMKKTQGDYSNMESYIQSFRQDDSAHEKTGEPSDLQEEIDRALVVVNELFPEINVDRLKTTYKARVHLREKLARNEFTKSVVRDASWMGVSLRYNPTIPSHNDKFEVKETQRDANSENFGEARTDHGGKSVNPIEAKLGGPRYFTASEGLNSMFSRVRKNSEDGIVGEAALDGVFNKKPATSALMENEVEFAQPESNGAFKLSSLFDFAPKHDVSKEASTKTREYLSNEDINGKKNEDVAMWDDTNVLNSELISGSEVETDEDLSGDDDYATECEEIEKETLPKGPDTVTNASVRCIDDLLMLGTSFANGHSTHKLDWQTFRAKLATDFKRKRKEALKNRKKKQKSHDK